MNEGFSAKNQAREVARTLARYYQHRDRPWRWSLARGMIASALAIPGGPDREERKAIATQAMREVKYPGLPDLPAEEDEG